MATSLAKEKEVFWESVSSVSINWDLQDVQEAVWKYLVTPGDASFKKPGAEDQELMPTGTWSKLGPRPRPRP
jgi:hypothetical protein